MYKASVVGQIELNTANAKLPASSSSSSSNLSAAACLEPEDAELGVLFSTPRLLRPVFDSVGSDCKKHSQFGNNMLTKISRGKKRLFTISVPSSADHLFERERDV